MEKRNPITPADKAFDTLQRALGSMTTQHVSGLTYVLNPDSSKMWKWALSQDSGAILNGLMKAIVEVAKEQEISKDNAFAIFHEARNQCDTYLNGKGTESDSTTIKAKRDYKDFDSDEVQTYLMVANFNAQQLSYSGYNILMTFYVDKNKSAHFVHGDATKILGNVCHGLNSLFLNLKAKPEDVVSFENYVTNGLLDYIKS